MYPCNVIETVAAAHRDKNTGEGRLSGRVEILVSASDSTEGDVTSYAYMIFQDGVPKDTGDWNPSRGNFYNYNDESDYLLYCCEAS